MAIKYNPYNWEIRQNDDYLKKLIEQRDYCLRIIASSHGCGTTELYAMSKYIYQLNQIQEKIDIWFMQNNELEKVYGR